MLNIKGRLLFYHTKNYLKSQASYVTFGLLNK